MRAADVALAVLVAVLWGLAFVATRIGLDTFSPAQLTALRSVIAAAPALALPRPAVPWPALSGGRAHALRRPVLFSFSASRPGCRPGWRRSSCRRRRCSPS